MCYKMLHYVTNLKNKIMAKKKPITALNVLSQMDVIARRLAAPSMPPNYIMPTKFPEKNANNVENAIERFAKISGFMAERTKSQGRQLPAKHIDTPIGRVQTSKSIFIPGTTKNGSSDMKLVIPGLGFVACEVKFGKDTQKPDQKKYQKEVENSGGIYIIVKSFEDFLIWYVSKKGRPSIMQQAIKDLS